LIVFRVSFSGDRVGRFESRFASAFFVESAFRFRGSTAPVVGVDFGARPNFGRVLACLCFLPNRFLSSRFAFAIAAPFPDARRLIHYREVQDISSPLIRCGSCSVGLLFVIPQHSGGICCCLFSRSNVRLALK
jgi:hypothetical protein